MPTSTSTVSKRLFVFDFDWTLIEADSDHWIMLNLGKEFCEGKEEEFKTVQWTDLQDELLRKMYAKGVTTADIVESLQRIPFAAETIAALRLMKSNGAELCIISDANTFYIDTILKHHGLDQLFSTIITNPAHFDEKGHLRISRFHGLDKPPHGCERPCAVNLCKGQELQKLIDAKAWDQVIYMGDSTNDFCPSTRLQCKDIVLARSNLLLEKAIRANPEMVKAQVIYWDGPPAVLAAVRTIYNIPHTKPLPALASVSVPLSTTPVATTV
ncbi:hypothetical protein BGZ94_004298 [Podila epigama]|nr:hypothetical protein BGZ94_004298 [Podila epigama]